MSEDLKLSTSAQEHGIRLETLPSLGDDTSDMRALVGSMLGPENIQALDDGSLRALSSVLLERMMFARQAGLSFHGARDMYEVLGYDRVLTYRMYRARYARGGIAKRIVDAYPVAIWRGGAEVWEDEDASSDTQFEQTWKELEARLSIWSRLQRAHILAGLSTYSVLLIGAPGNISDELPKGTPDSLLYLTPFSGGGGPGGDRLSRSMAMDADCSIQEFDVDPESPRFGLPQIYQLKRTDLSSPMLNRPVHWSRIIHVAEGLLGDEVYGTPALEAVWNDLDNLDKVVGGGAEAFWLRANAGLHLDVDKSMGAPGTPTKPGNVGLDPAARTALQDKATELQHQLQRVMVTRGVTATQLGSNVANFKDPADAIITLIAGTKAIPKRILVGSEMGQLASGQDKDNWNTQVQDKRTSWAFPCLVKPLIDRLVAYGYLPEPIEVHVEWPVIEDLTEDEKAGLAVTLTNSNKTQGTVVFETNWIREKTFGLEPLDDERMPVGAPERISVDATKGQKPPLLAAAEEALRALDNPEGINQYTGAIGHHVIEHTDKGIVHHGVFKTKAEAHKKGKSLRKSGHANTFVFHSKDIAKFGIKTAAESEIDETIAALEAAIEADDLQAIARIVGIDA